MFDDYNVRPSQDMCDDWQTNFEHFNEKLFNFELPNCAILLQRRNGTYGFFNAEIFKREDGKYAHEISLNPALYDPDYPIAMLSVLVHEMVHLWQFLFGIPGRGRYHNREWADKMIALGLQPTNTGKPGRRETGDSMHHIIVQDSPFESAARELIGSRTIVTWTESHTQKFEISLARQHQTLSPEQVLENGETATGESIVLFSKSGKRFRYKCPEFNSCKQSSEGRFGLEIKCIAHDLKLVIVERKKRQPGEGLPFFQ